MSVDPDTDDLLAREKRRMAREQLRRAVAASQSVVVVTEEALRELGHLADELDALPVVDREALRPLRRGPVEALEEAIGALGPLNYLGVPGDVEERAEKLRGLCLDLKDAVEELFAGLCSANPEQAVAARESAASVLPLLVVGLAAFSLSEGVLVERGEWPAQEPAAGAQGNPPIPAEGMVLEGTRVKLGSRHTDLNWQRAQMLRKLPPPGRACSGADELAELLGRFSNAADTSKTARTRYSELAGVLLTGLGVECLVRDHGRYGLAVPLTVAPHDKHGCTENARKTHEGGSPGGT